MKSRIMRYSLLLCLVLSLLFGFSACSSRQMRRYYSEQDNYINATGIVSHIAYNEGNDSLYLAFSELSPTFDDTNFKIVGDNLTIVQKNGIDEKIKIGDSVEFITAPKYFGDGYVMPIVALSLNGETMLEFETGYENFQKWLRA